ncbi:hypothetical protein Poli38472_008035 [Pythium oligandrum]|uniref:Uncharacterized protein n=1 Tax=Pythium oligandrum TaxID=41045 RepID=A0A8K1CN92_PYTOL|nr:hypothetical protein Poli38472_008035 [Pythium oligandrum]|eukprot:TMW65393.1 hypothetical protein Poli38472_008035 [Pythium oligandrum]
MSMRLKPLVPASPSAQDVENRVLSSLVLPVKPPKWISSLVYVAIWLCVLAVHGACCTYFLFMWWFYRILPKSILTRYLKLYDLGIPDTEYALVSRVHVLFFGLHAFSGVAMVLWSLRMRRLSFGPWYHKVQRSPRRQRPRSLRWFPRDSPRLSRWLSRLFGRRGLLGIESPYYNIVHLLRQLLETALQSYQAYRMSLHVPRVWLNQLYISIMILSCWSISIIKLVKMRDPLRERMLLILCDILLDLVASIGVSVILLLSFLPDFDMVSLSMRYFLWYNGFWIVHAVSESQLILVQSRMDLFTQAMFSMGLLWYMESLKDLMEITLQRRAIAPRVGPPALSVPTPPAIETAKVSPPRMVTFPRSRGKLWLKVVQFGLETALVMWGIVLLGLHIHVASRATIHQCLMQVRPWLSHKSACALLVVDCYAAGITGSEAEATDVWDDVNEKTVLRVMIRHCPNFHMPPQVQAFRELRGIKFYNSTVAKWTKDAEMTQTFHPNLLTVLLVRTNATNGEIPRGLLSSNIPRRLMDIEFCVTNLRALPDNLDKIWHTGGTYHIEYAQFDAIPPSILRLQPRQLSFVGNNLTRFPFEVLNLRGLFYLNLAYNPISSLATVPYQHLVDNSSLGRILLTHSNISSVPRWLDPFFRRKYGSRAPLIVLYTPLRTRLAAGQSLRSQADDLGIPEAERSFVMNLTAEEAAAFISCSVPATPYYYPLPYEDLWNSLH